jgi:hypothetical protein
MAVPPSAQDRNIPVIRRIDEIRKQISNMEYEWEIFGN